MNSTIHERPGVYSSYDASTAISSGGAGKVIGVAAKAASGDTDQVTTLTSCAGGIAIFGKDKTGTHMAALLEMLYRNGASRVIAVRVPDTGTKAEYTAAFALLEEQDEIGVMLCDSESDEVQKVLRDSVVSASGARRERIAVAGSTDETVSELIARAKAVNSERVVLVAGGGLDETGTAVPGILTAAAVAGVIASTVDPALPLNGAVLKGLGGLSQRYSDSEIDLLVRGGVTPLDCVSGTVSILRGITTRTTTDDAADTTWRELSTILIVDDVIPQIRSALRRKFARSKNTAQTRSAIRSQVIVELENKRSAQIIDSFGEVQTAASASDATVCEVTFSFTVAHGLNQIRLTAHITI